MDRLTTEALVIETLLKEAWVDSYKILLTYKLVPEAVVIHILLNEALVDNWTVQLRFVIPIVDRLTTEAVF